jgi:polyisoprenoid-binding protein YceI
MQRSTVVSLGSLLAGVFLGMLGVPGVARADAILPPAGTYQIEHDGSSVTFTVTEMLVNKVTGKFGSFGGTVVVGDSLEKSRVEASVDVTSIDTNIHKRDEHLRTADYFDAAKFPRLTFKSTALWGTPASFYIKGNLTIKGVSKEIVFGARLADGGVVSAEATIQRKDFGLTAGKVIKNDVHLHLHIRMTKAP